MVDDTPDTATGNARAADRRADDGASPQDPQPARQGRSGGWRAWLDGIGTIVDRTGILLVFVGLSGFGLLSGQGQDVLRAMTEGGEDWYLESPLLLFVAGLLLLSFNLWFWSRLLLSFRIKEGDPFPGELWMRRHLPRLFAAAGLAVPGIAGLVEGDPRPRLLGGTLVALGALAALLLGPERQILWQRAFRLRQWQGFVRLFRGAGAVRAEAAILVCSLAIFVALLLAFAFGPATFGMTLGMAAVLSLWAASMVPVAGLLDLTADVLRLPILAILLVAALVFSLWNDNHGIRRTEAQAVEGLPDVQSHFARWYADRRAERTEAGLAGPVPLVLVASEGGGIRSAYWTAAILAELQDRNPDFARHVFAVSGVSGGSMGAAVFSSLIANATPLDGAEDTVCPRLQAGAAAPPKNAGPMRLMARDLLGRDYLSPILGGLLFPDLLQRFLPVPVTAFDRARIFEESWEDVWDEACGLAWETPERHRAVNPFAAPLQDLWHGPRRTVVPALLLNSTRVETGQRTVISNLSAFQSDTAFVDVLPLMNLISMQQASDDRLSLPTITAASLSARFPVVSPVGAIRLQLSPVPAQATAPLDYIRLADGGYYENSGADTLSDAMTLVLRAAEAQSADIRPVVVQISNDPGALLPPPWRRNPAQIEDAAALEIEVQGAPIAGELMSPVRTMLSTRSARGTEERERLASRARVRDIPYLHFFLCQSEGKEPPLGWYLSEETQDLIDRHLSDPQTCAEFGVDNVATLESLADFVDGQR
jgi:hypothetical protein